MTKMAKITKTDTLVIKKIYPWGPFGSNPRELRFEVERLRSPFGSYILKKIGANRNHLVNACIGKCKNFAKTHMLFLVCVAFLGNTAASQSTLSTH